MKPVIASQKFNSQSEIVALHHHSQCVIDRNSESVKLRIISKLHPWGTEVTAAY